MLKRQDQEWMKHWDFMLIDVLCLQISLIIMSYIRRGVWIPYLDHTLSFQASVITLCHLAIMPFTGSYNGIVHRYFLYEVWMVFKFALSTFLLALLYLFVSKHTDSASRLLIGWSLVIYILLDVFARSMNKKRIFARRKDEKMLSIVLVTSSSFARRTYDKLFCVQALHNIKLTHVFLMGDFDTSLSAEIGNVPVDLLDENTLDTINHMYVDEVLVVQPDNMCMPKAFIDKLIDMGITVDYSNSFMAYFTEIHRLGYFDVLSTSSKIVSSVDLAVKRLFDIVVGLFGSIATLIIYIFLAPIIKIKSPGPVFFKQDRVGKNGKIFRLYKFRSMYMDAEKRKAELESMNKIAGGLMFKIDDDPRIIGSEKKDKNGKPRGIGNFIRRTSLDEFPQFFNVLKGEMSMVGVRPPTVDEWEKYSPDHRIRLSGRPGLTGMWQISGRSNITDFNEVVALDRYYIEHWSLSLDFHILLKTGVAIFKRKGAF
jgi:exopolysaccharide biosynthesis polyprenyl glycosylphosphotransferase